MRMKRTIERDRVVSTIQMVRSAPFSPTARKLVERTLPQAASGEINDIYKDSSEERRKLKSDDL